MRKTARSKSSVSMRKKARGLMSAWIIRQQINDPEALKDFDVAGYRFDSAASEGDTLVFIRRETDR